MQIVWPQTQFEKCPFQPRGGIVAHVLAGQYFVFAKHAGATKRENPAWGPRRKPTTSIFPTP